MRARKRKSTCSRRESDDAARDILRILFLVLESVAPRDILPTVVPFAKNRISRRAERRERELIRRRVVLYYFILLNFFDEERAVGKANVMDASIS
jgi:hypothetical protein